MADLKIDQSKVNWLQDHLHDIQSTLNALSGSGFEPSRDNVGSHRVIGALQDFNSQVCDTQQKYQRKAQRFVDYLSQVTSASDEADEKIAASIS